MNNNIQKKHSSIRSSVMKKLLSWPMLCTKQIRYFQKREKRKLQFLIRTERNEESYVKNIIANHFKLSIISETKLDGSFPKAQFQISGYKCLRRDRNVFGAGLCLYIYEDISSKQIDTR